MGKMRLAIVGEGPNDYGSRDGFGIWKEGAAQPFVRGAIKDHEIEFHPIHKAVSKNRLVSPGVNRRKQLRGPGIKLVDLANETKNYEFDGLVFFHDLDKTSGERASENECKRRFLEFTTELSKAINWFSEETGVPCIPMVPARMIECWLLADAGSYAHAFGKSPSNPQLPSSPELVWGDKEIPSSNFPKFLLNRVIAQFGYDSTTEIMHKLASHSNRRTLEQKCKISYPYFANHIDAFVETFQSRNM